ncbi:MAG: hypothetical protein PVF58_06595 [Candidatus Methanofastidiosia archaeon]|jgi:hypothetical protein
MKRFLIVLLLLSLIGQVYAEDPLTVEIKTDKETYESQSRGVLQVMFKNYSGDTAEDIQVSVTSAYVTFLEETAEIEEVNYGSKVVPFRFRCKSLEDGEYLVTVKYSYMSTSKSCTGGICQSVRDEKNHVITIENGKPNVSVESNTLKVIDNKTGITFKNSGRVAIDFQFDITSDVKVQYESYIGYLLSVGSKELIIYGEPGEYDASVTVQYKDPFDREYTKTFLLRIIIEENQKETSTPQFAEDQIRKIKVSNMSTGDVSTPMSQYYVYFLEGCCLVLMGIGVAAKLKGLNIKG